MHVNGLGIEYEGESVVGVDDEDPVDDPPGVAVEGFHGLKIRSCSVLVFLSE